MYHTAKLKKMLGVPIVLGIMMMLFQAQSGCNNSTPPCPEDVVLSTFYLSWNAGTHPKRNSLYPPCNLESGPVKPCGPAFTSFDETLFGKPSYNDYHMFQVTISGDCEDLKPPVVNYVTAPLNGSCVDFATYLPDGVEVKIDIIYVEPCTDCYDYLNFPGYCGPSYRTVFIANSTFTADANVPNLNWSFIPLSYLGSYCSEEDNCTNLQFREGI